MILRIAFSLVLFGVLLFAAQEEVGLPIIYADFKTISDEVLHAWSHVEAISPEYHLYAEDVQYFFKTKLLLAKGRVTMATKYMVLSGDKLRLDLKSGTGEMSDSFGLLTPFGQYQTDSLLQTDKRTFKFGKLTFTACSQLVPRWSLTARKGKIKKDDYVQLQDVVFRLWQVPVFYFPFLRYPIAKEGRSSGFLFPNFGNGRYKGFYIQNAFFWNMRSNLDMTFYFDYFSKLGLGWGDEFRYLFHGGSGDIKCYYFRYFDANNPLFAMFSPSSNPKPNADDFFINAEHKQTFSFANSRLILQANYPSNPNFLRLMDTDFDRALSTNFLSALNWTAALGNFSLSLTASRSETFYTEKNSSNVITYLPSLALDLKQQNLGKFPGYFSFSLDYQNISRHGVSYEELPDLVSDIQGQRLIFSPAYSLRLFHLTWLNASVKLFSKQGLYGKSRDPNSNDIVAEPLHVKSYGTEISVQGPILARIYSGSRNKLKHVIEPTIKFRYVSKVNNRKQLVPMDMFDYPSYSYVGFSLTNRLLVKNAGTGSSAQEVLSHTIAQQYFLDPEEANFFRTINNEYPVFSELSNQLTFRPSSTFSLSANAKYHYTLKTFSLLNLSLNFDLADGALSSSLSLNKTRNPYRLTDNILNRTILRAEIQLNAPSFPIKFRGGADYDLTEHSLRYVAVNARYDYQCLIFLVEYKRTIFFGQHNSVFFMSIALGNLGMVEDIFGGKP